MGWLSGALLGIAAVAAAPFTGGGSLLAAGVGLGSSLAGAGTMAMAAGAAVTGAAAGQALSEMNEEEAYDRGNRNGYENGYQVGCTDTMKKLRDKMQANNKLKLGVFALAYYVARVDGEFAYEEQSAIEQAVGRPDYSWAGVGAREDYDNIIKANMSFNTIVRKYFDDLDKETFEELDEVVMDVVNADNKISAPERDFLDNDWYMLKRMYR